jgi:DNA polymerase-3 subunit beta
MFIERIDKEALLKPIQIVIGIVERKQTMPILSNVLIEANENKLVFTSTDLEIQISTMITIEGNSIGAISLNGKKLQEILRILPDQSKINVDLMDNKAIIRSNRSKFNLQSLPAVDFPLMKKALNEPIKITLNQKILKRLLSSVQFAMGNQDIRYYLNGVLFVFEDDLFKTVATDGHRLAYNAVLVDTFSVNTSIIIPRKAVIELLKMLSEDENDMIELEFTDQLLRVSFSGIEIITKLIENKFPDYQRVIPNYSNHLIINRLLVQQGLQRAAILSNEKSRGVRFILTSDTLRITSNNNEQEEALVEIEIEYEGENLDIGFNINYLMDGLTSIQSDLVIFSFGNANSSVLISSPENHDFRYVVMPMRI